MPVDRDSVNVVETFACMKKIDHPLVGPKFLKKRPVVGCGDSGEVGLHFRAQPLRRVAPSASFCRFPASA